MSKDFTDELYKDFLKDKFVDAKELVSMINGRLDTGYDKTPESLAEVIIDLIYSHAQTIQVIKWK